MINNKNNMINNINNQNNMINNINNIYIILDQFKKEYITEEEAVQLISGLYSNWNTPTITYPQPIQPLYYTITS